MFNTNFMILQSKYISIVLVKIKGIKIFVEYHLLLKNFAIKNVNK